MTRSEETFQEAMEQGHSAAWDQAWEKAANHYRRAVKEFPENPMALTSLGLALFEQQKYEESLNFYARAAKVSPDDPLPVEKIAQVYERLGNIQRARAAAFQAAELHLKNRDVNKAIENWTRVATLDPENLQVHTRLALVYERLGMRSEAAGEYVALAALFQRAGDLTKARGAAERALLAQPGDPEALDTLALLGESRPIPLPERPRGGTAPLRMAQVRDLDRQEEDSRAARKMDPVVEARQAALTMLASLLFDAHEESQGEGGRGLQSIVRGTGKLPRKPLDQTKIVLHLSQLVDSQTRGDLSQAMVELERAIDAGLEHPAAYYDLGYMQFQSDKVDGAVKNLQNAVQHSDFALGARLLIGQVFVKKGRMREAAVEFMEALRLADARVAPADQSDALLQLYEPLVEAQSHETDAQAHKQVCENIAAILLRPEWREQLGQARRQLPSRADGGPLVPLAEVLTQARSGHIVESLSKIYQLDRDGYLRSAMEEAFYALHFAPTYLPLHVYMGELLLKQNQMKEAIEKFVMVAQSYSSRGEARRAIELYRRIIELAPLELDSRARLIEQLMAVGQAEEAISSTMDFAEVYYQMADLDKARKTYTEAIRLAQQSNVERTWQARILHRMADIDLQSLEWRQALRIYEQIRTLQPEDEKARAALIELNFRLGQEQRAVGELENYLAYLWNKGQQPKALKFLENLVREEPNRAGVRRRLAEHYHHTGRYAEEIAQLDAIGEILMDAGDTQAAIKVIESILMLKPANAVDYQRVLSQLRGK
ncbi:MAG: tetratricopeptide repeat protein [Chloroflexi bacterium]|nr:tetratricopeptide repeat protein [Chloroflexota bacterium]